MSNIKGARVILDEMNTGYLRDRLLGYPDEIVTLKKQIRLLREKADAEEQVRAILEATMVMEIADEVDFNTGKARFTNEKSRAGELMRRKSEDAEYQAALKVARGAMFEVNGLEDELVGIEDKFKATRFVARLLAAELEFMSDFDGEDGRDEEVVRGTGFADRDRQGSVVERDSMGRSVQPY